MTRDRWTTEEFRHYRATGEEPAEDTSQRRKVPCDVRAEKRVTKGRCKRVTVSRPDLGVTFDSLTEERFYEHLCGREDVVHVDIHPWVSLPGGIRKCFDFLVWPMVCLEARPTVCDVKGRKPSTAFNRIRKLFDAHHPLAPLRVVVWDRKVKYWREI